MLMKYFVYVLSAEDTNNFSFIHNSTYRDINVLGDIELPSCIAHKKLKN